MKNSKTFLLLSVIVAVLVLGIAYAALTSELSITTQATVAPDGSNFNVAFTAGALSKIQTEGADATEANKALVTIGQSGQAAQLTVAEGALKTVGDYVEVTYTVTNSSQDLKATLGEITVEAGNNNEYVSFTASYGTPDSLELAAQTGTNTVVVRATLIKAPSEATVTATATVKFTAEAVEA